jgi:hypothetical protein
MSAEPTHELKCRHVASGTLPFAAVEVENVNGQTHRGTRIHVRWMLCAFCAGQVVGIIAQLEPDDRGGQGHGD